MCCCRAAAAFEVIDHGIEPSSEALIEMLVNETRAKIAKEVLLARGVDPAEIVLSKLKAD